MERKTLMPGKHLHGTVFKRLSDNTVVNIVKNTLGYSIEYWDNAQQQWGILLTPQEVSDIPQLEREVIEWYHENLDKMNKVGK